jgi:hypothetical protein
MIGVSIPESQHDIAREFFQLCKTPWQFWKADQEYQVVICNGNADVGAKTKLVIAYGGHCTQSEFPSIGHEPHPASKSFISYRRCQMPIYGECSSFAGSSADLAFNEANGEPSIRATRVQGRTTVEIGYDLFAEVRHLLELGQPDDCAACPTIELHISLLREIITRAGLPFVEIPPSPEGYSFCACLTHDVDHPVLRNHFFDPTMLGFIYRATLGAAGAYCLGRISLKRLWRNWNAAGRLPFIYAKLADDIWHDFGRYREIEGNKPSTFFVIPLRGVPGRKKTGHAPRKRGCKYTLSEIKAVLERITAGGSEVAVHGIDAWLDSKSGLLEKAELAQINGANSLGVRMHWLYFDEPSPSRLEAAGFRYDSSLGYNNTVGYRSGTTQVFRPLRTQHLLEIPLHVMDTALFYPDYLNLSEKEAHRIVTALISNASRFGGVFTVNWHDRSIAPERLWDVFYRELLEELDVARAWFATAAQVANWFQMRRSATFSKVEYGNSEVTVRAHLSVIDSTLPRPKIRIYKPSKIDASQPFGAAGELEFTDSPLISAIDSTINL